VLGAKKGAMLLPARPKSREETPKKGCHQGAKIARLMTSKICECSAQKSRSKTNASGISRQNPLKQGNLSHPIGLLKIALQHFNAHAALLPGTRRKPSLTV